MLASLSIRELRELLARREVSALEVARAHLDRIDALDDETVRSLLTVTRERAEEQAKQADARLRAGENAPLLGVPMILKDVLTTRGIRTTAGSKILEQFVPIEDATITRRLAEAGTVLLGKSNMDEFARAVLRPPHEPQREALPARLLRRVMHRCAVAADLEREAPLRRKSGEPERHAAARGRRQGRRGEAAQRMLGS